jgi:hypothetical protein
MAAVWATLNRQWRAAAVASEYAFALSTRSCGRARAPRPGCGHSVTSSVVPWHEYSGRDVEDLIAALLVRTVTGAQRIDGSGGDDGVDVRAPVDGGYRIYQIKGFHTRLTSSHKRQIAASLATAVQRQSEMVRWTLVLPLDLSPGEERWFSGVLGPESSVPIDWVGRSQIEERLSVNRDLLRAFAPGSTERRAMDLLGEYNAEKAALSRGMADGIERLAGLKNQLDLADPDWAFDVRVSGESINVELRPKDPESAKRSPIGIAFEVSENDAAVAQQVEKFMRYGRPVQIPRESIVRFEADLPGNLAEVIRQSGKPSLSFGNSDQEQSWQLSQRADAVRDGKVIGTLPIEWNDRSQGPLGGSWVSGKDRSGFLELAMTTEPDLKGGIQISAPASDSVLPEDVVPVLKFLNLLKVGDHLRLIAVGHPEIEARLIGNPLGDSHVLESGIAIAEAVARIQAAAGTRFPMPASWTGKDAEMTYFWDQLLAHGEVQWYWPGYAVNIPAGRVSQLLADSVIPRISMTGTSENNPEVELFGNKFRIEGQLRCVVTDMLVPNPRALAKHVCDAPPDTPVAVTLAQDDRTLSFFYLDQDLEVPRAGR